MRKVLWLKKKMFYLSGRWMNPAVRCVHPESIKRLHNVLQVQPVRSPSICPVRVVSSEFETTECIHIV